MVIYTSPRTQATHNAAAAWLGYPRIRRWSPRFFVMAAVCTLLLSSPIRPAPLPGHDPLGHRSAHRVALRLDRPREPVRSPSPGTLPRQSYGPRHDQHGNPRQSFAGRSRPSLPPPQVVHRCASQCFCLRKLAVRLPGCCIVGNPIVMPFYTECADKAIALIKASMALLPLQPHQDY